MPFSSLKGEKSFNRARGGRPGRGRLVSVRWNPLRPNAFNPVRVGIVVSKKVGKAVVRNRIRRRLKEILRKMHLPPSETVIVVQPEAAAASYWELLRDLSHAMKKSGLVQ
ncbi:MAG: ribonuclease P protein component [Meiothermus sp.]|nr:ribonuclease P protein component [Meiothermus sp.]